MSRTAVPREVEETSRLTDSWFGQLAAILAMLAVLTAWLTLLGRPFLCSCGTVRLFVSEATSHENSQQVADFYSGLHIVFGFALFVFLDWMKPGWTKGRKLLVAIASSVAWESVENIPLVISLFGNAPGSPAYSGDSILNALFDTGFVAAGFLVAGAVPLVVTLVLALAIEVAVSLAINDGLVLGTLRLFNVPV